MAISKKMDDFARSASWIRKMFEEGARLKAEYGADNVFDFSLGNPDLSP
ncbi:MAG: pyridoxal phosphate-dependent aminotransferase, partial [Deltaproteobacteria bacterium]|nr:pyridoxal phosphate-dependent aminotransferase [Deltaproteobacteria bacterium]